MRCEACGRKIYGKSYKVVIEGARLTVCSKCAKYGRIVWEEKKPKAITPRTKALGKRMPLEHTSKRPLKVAAESNLELVEKFDAKIRQARLKLGLSHEELGRKISEKVSVLKNVEKGKMTPDNKLTTKLGHSLKIKLLVPASDQKVPKTKVSKPLSHELTLGDLIKLEKKKVEEKQ